MHAERERRVATETTSPMTREQISARFRAIAPYPDSSTPDQAKALAGWLTGQAQRRWTRCLDLIDQEGPLYLMTISAMLSDFAALHLLMGLTEIDTATADRLAAEIRETWDSDGEVGPLIWQHAVALGIDPAEVSRLEEACYALEVSAKGDVTAYHAGFRTLLPAERLAVSVATAQAGRGDSVPPNTATALLLILKRLTGDGTQERTEEGQ
jgi:hypothetical protein